MKSIIIGTAGHIDHGKTALTTALTGIDTDRLPQEKARGISIELGFAPLRYSDDFIVGIVDVPGHERFVKTMVTGATQIDFVLFVIAANEGMMPQSREHLLILTGLGLKKGIVVFSKADLLSEEERLVAAEQVQKELEGTFLEKAPVFFVSAKTSEGISELRQKIFEYTHYQPEMGGEIFPGGRISYAASARREHISPHGHLVCGGNDRVKGLTRVWIDRVFTLVGHGTVVTGPLISGQLRLEDELELYPKHKIVRVRRIHAYGRAFNEISAPCRIALNIKGVSKEEISRGDVLGKPETLVPTLRAMARVEMFPLFANKVRSVGKISPHTLNFFSFHIGTTRALVSIKGGGDGISFLKFSKPLVVLPGDRFILRRETTVGAGEIVGIPSPKPAPVLKKISLPKKEIDPEKIVKLPGGVYISSAQLQIVKTKLKTFFETNAEMRVGDLKNMLSVSRKLAIPYLQFFDEQKWTIRKGDVRVPWKIIE